MKKLFIHGLGQNSSSWNEVVKNLEDNNDIMQIELQSPTKDKITYDYLYVKFKNQIDEEVIDLVGLSLGGVLALNYAIDYPEKVNSLVIINGQYKMPKLLLKLQSFIFKFIPEKRFSRLGFNKKDFISITRSMENLNFKEDLSKIKCKTMVINGGNDKINKKVAIEMTKFIRNSKLEFINNAGYEINIEKPIELAKILNEFYEK